MSGDESCKATREGIVNDDGKIKEIANALVEACFADHMLSSGLTSFGLGKLVDWDAEAMTEIEGIRSGPFGGIDRNPSQYWRSTRYGASETEGE